MSRYLKEGTTFIHGKCEFNTCQFWRAGCDIMSDTSCCKRRNALLEIKKEVEK